MLQSTSHKCLFWALSARQLLRLGTAKKHETNTCRSSCEDTKRPKYVNANIHECTSAGEQGLLSRPMVLGIDVSGTIKIKRCYIALLEPPLGRITSARLRSPSSSKQDVTRLQESSGNDVGVRTNRTKCSRQLRRAIA